MPGNKPKIKE